MVITIPLVTTTFVFGFTCVFLFITIHIWPSGLIQLMLCDNNRFHILGLIGYLSSMLAYQRHAFLCFVCVNVACDYLRILMCPIRCCYSLNRFPLVPLYIWQYTKSYLG